MPIDNPRAIFLPYCIQRLEDGRYVVLNRNYKPLGFRTTEFLRYEDYHNLCEVQGSYREESCCPIGQRTQRSGSKSISMMMAVFRLLAL